MKKLYTEKLYNEFTGFISKIASENETEKVGTQFEMTDWIEENNISVM
ncbi:hypothetical protein [Cytobacillus praedii]|nr:hypothetical protein [Cytobacillus praedii]